MTRRRCNPLWPTSSGWAWLGSAAARGRKVYDLLGYIRGGGHEVMHALAAGDIDEAVRIANEGRRDPCASRLREATSG